MYERLIKVFLLLALTGTCLNSKCQKIEKPGTFVPIDLKDSGKVLLVKIAEYEKGKIKKYQKAFAENYSGAFEIVPSNVSVDRNYSDLTVYKYVLVIAGALREGDFAGISNKDNFFDKTDSSFLNKGSSMYIFDRSSNRELYEARAKNITKKISYERNGVYYYYPNNNDDEISFKILKTYIAALNEN